MSALSTPKPLPSKLREARGDATQEGWAATLGVSVFYVAKLERGERSPSLALLWRISVESDKPLEWFYGEGAAA